MCFTSLRKLPWSKWRSFTYRVLCCKSHALYQCYQRQRRQMTGWMETDTDTRTTNWGTEEEEEVIFGPALLSRRGSEVGFVVVVVVLLLLALLHPTQQGDAWWTTDEEKQQLNEGEKTAAGWMERWMDRTRIFVVFRYKRQFSSSCDAMQCNVAGLKGVIFVGRMKKSGEKKEGSRWR